MTTEPVVVEESAFKDVQIAMLQKQTVQLRAQQVMRDIEQEMAAAERAMAAAMTAAGLDPAVNYQIDFKTRVATPAAGKSATSAP